MISCRSPEASIFAARIPGPPAKPAPKRPKNRSAPESVAFTAFKAAEGHNVCDVAFVNLLYV